jgi:hypothetical protein
MENSQTMEQEKSDGERFNEEYERIIRERVQEKIADWTYQLNQWKAGHIFDK